MPETDKKSLRRMAKEFSVEIGTLTVFITFMLVLLFDKSFSNSIITNFEFLRPEYAIIWFGVMICLAALLVLFYCLGVRKKKLQSTKKKSAFAKTVKLSDKAREMSQTQTVFVSKVQTTGKKNDLPKDIDVNSPDIIELYFTYEESLNI